MGDFFAIFAWPCAIALSSKPSLVTRQQKLAYVQG